MNSPGIERISLAKHERLRNCEGTGSNLVSVSKHWNMLITMYQVRIESKNMPMKGTYICTKGPMTNKGFNGFLVAITFAPVTHG